ncbi:MAG: ATP synthase F1 subunit epsilon [Longicatena sp.]
MIKVKIITPVGLYMDEEVEAINVRTIDGETTILSHHMPIVAMLQTCKYSLKIKGEYKPYALAGGLLQYREDEMHILTDAIEGKEEIDIERAKRAKERAENRLAKTDVKNTQRAEAALAKAMNRINVYQE